MSEHKFKIGDTVQHVDKSLTHQDFYRGEVICLSSNDNGHYVGLSYTCRGIRETHYQYESVLELVVYTIANGSRSRGI
jgi:hypothetical protein